MSEGHDSPSGRLAGDPPAEPEAAQPGVSRRVALRRIGVLGAAVQGTALLAGCGGGADADEPPVAAPQPAPAPPAAPTPAPTAAPPALPPSPAPSTAPTPAPVPPPPPTTSPSPTPPPTSPPTSPPPTSPAPTSPPTSPPPPPPPPTSPPAPPPPAPPPAPPTLLRLWAGLRLPAPVVQAVPVEVSQRPGGPGASSFGAGAVFVPAWGDTSETLANAARVWGHRREFWRLRSGASIGGVTVRPVLRAHVSSNYTSEVPCALHFEHEGLAFEMQFGGRDVQVTLIADGRYAAPGLITTTTSQPEALVRFQFDRIARRRISVYGISSLGPISLGVPAGESLQPWDRSSEASCAFMTDSYGGALGPQWRAGPFFEAAARLGIPHVDIDAIGGTGYAPNNASPELRDPGNAFPARLAGLVEAKPDLVFTAGGINDNNSIAAPPLHATGEAARAAFEQAVSGYYRNLRAALPQAVLVAMGPWAPRQSVPTDAVARSKADTILAALQAAGGPWVFLDNLEGQWRNSAGALSSASGPWQTGTGTSAVPRGDGNGDLYLSADGVHPNAAGCGHLGERIAADLRAALLALA